ncbi:hypothetical protein FIBSPDRAFT_856365 [Athelia psychrophila]|uniref:HTH TFE/IIEalpha-type domain-containing protein n=1 Tax=Athelia psychrophila TaxID=1759441 RepID=A0A166NGT0_9AGAM|nr:hypothetical protein FIBSPDRAFT_856365 [Fibularhizoctonia sp. CBS 109695]
MATKEDQETLRLLVQQVSRAFYESKFTIILDQLARHPVLKDDDLAGRLGMQAKEINKLMAVLTNDRLVQTHRQNELKEGAQRSVLKQYYYIDYQFFCNVVKWRVAEMRRRIDTNLRNELDNRGYICPQCKKSYSTIEVDRVMDFVRGVFACEDCSAELVDNEDADSVKGSQDRMQRFNKQMTWIREGLRKSEAMLLPAFDVALWVKNNSNDNDRQRASTSGGLKVAGSGPGSGQADDSIGVVMSMDKDEATRRQERDAVAEAKRQQNALPEWIKKSTVSGHFTASGLAESARAEAAATPSSNDEILRGLGTVGLTKAEESKLHIMEDIKPVIDHDAIDYDQYYASLAATASTNGTPAALPGDDYGISDDEEDRKPNVEYLNSLNDYRKRSRSRDDVGTSTPKLAKLHDNGFDAAKTNGNGHMSSADALGAHAILVDGASSVDPTVFVNGVPKAFSEVTEDDHHVMTPEEYTAYFEVFEAQSMY